MKIKFLIINWVCLLLFSACQNPTTTINPVSESTQIFWDDQIPTVEAMYVVEGDTISETLHYSFADSVLVFNQKEYLSFSIDFSHRWFELQNKYLRIEDDYLLILNPNLSEGRGYGSHVYIDTLVDFGMKQNSFNLYRTFTYHGWRSDVSRISDSLYTLVLRNGSLGEIDEVTFIVDKNKGLIRVTAPIINGSDIYL